MRLTVEGTNEILTSNGGLAVAGALMKSLKIGASLNKIRISGGEPEISNQDVIRSYLGLLMMGRTNYEDIELFRDDGIFRIMLDIKKVPSAGTLRQRFDAAQGAFDGEMLKFHVVILKKCPLSMNLFPEKKLRFPSFLDDGPHQAPNEYSPDVSTLGNALHPLFAILPFDRLRFPQRE